MIFIFQITIAIAIILIGSIKIIGYGPTAAWMAMLALMIGVAGLIKGRK